jgi:GT2 family glycosyltransferase
MSSTQASGPLLSGIVVHWHNEEQLAELLAAWPRDPRFELVVVDNGSALAPQSGATSVRWVRPGRNLGFAGGVNAGVAAASAPLLLLLNPDAAPEPGALDELLHGFAALPDAAGLAPRLTGPDGTPQAAWQLRDLPTALGLLAQALLLPPLPAQTSEPAAGTPVEQPAAAALALRRSALAAVGGLDERFFPAWFEDVDLARRLCAAGLRLCYWPAARFRHGLGSTVPRLGYGPFLWIYHRNLGRYLAKHHGPLWSAAARAALVLGALLRLALLPLHAPRRATGRGDAARAFLALLGGALSGWRRPRRLAGLGLPAGAPP